jgi:hypothetical protein
MADQSAVDRVYGYLRGKARMRATVTYTMVQQDLGIDLPYGSIVPLLDACAEISLAEKGVILPAIVVNKNSGVPGGKLGGDMTQSSDARSGFWKFCEDHGLLNPGDNPFEFLVKQQVKVYNAYGA